MVRRWLMSFCEIGLLMKRLDVGEGSYAKELGEDYDVHDALNGVMAVTLASEARCEEFKAQYAKFDYLWKKDLHVALQEFLAEQVNVCSRVGVLVCVGAVLGECVGEC
jgi:dynein heavy chain